MHIGTVSCDNTSNIELYFQNKHMFDVIAWANVRNPTLFIGALDYPITDGLEYNIEKDQIITRKDSDGFPVSTITTSTSAVKLN